MAMAGTRSMRVVVAGRCEYEGRFSGCSSSQGSCDSCDSIRVILARSPRRQVAYKANSLLDPSKRWANPVCMYVCMYVCIGHSIPSLARAIVSSLAVGSSVLITDPKSWGLHGTCSERAQCGGIGRPWSGGAVPRCC